MTGGSEGIGYGCTYTLLKHNIAKIYVLSVSEEVVQGAKASIAQELGQDAANKTTWLHCDLADWKGVKDVAERIKNENSRLDILINNAGRGIMPYELTEYGVDRAMAVNHMGPVVLTSHLLPLLKKTAEQGNIVRIANQASNAHQGAPKDTKFESLEEINRDSGPNGNYGLSKLAVVSCLHPLFELPRNIQRYLFSPFAFPFWQTWLLMLSGIDSLFSIFCEACYPCRPPKLVDECDTSRICQVKADQGGYPRSIPTRRVWDVCSDAAVHKDAI